MSLLDDLNLHTKTKGRRCPLGKILLQLEVTSPDTAAALSDAISSAREDRKLPVSQRLWTVAVLTDLLNKHQFSIGKTSVREHISEECLCARSTS